MSDAEKTEMWNFIEPGKGTIGARVVFIEFGDKPGKREFIGGELDDGRSVRFEDGEYKTVDGTVLVRRE